MTMLTANLFRATCLTIFAVAASLLLQTNQAQADDLTFTVDGLFSTDVIGSALGVTDSGLETVLHMDLPFNSSTPELFKLASGGTVFDATLIDSTPTEILTYDFTRAIVASLTRSGPYVAAQVNFATSTLTVRPTHVSAPEINPASALSSLLLLMGGLAVLRGRCAAAGNLASGVWA